MILVRPYRCRLSCASPLKAEEDMKPKRAKSNQEKRRRAEGRQEDGRRRSEMIEEGGSRRVRTCRVGTECCSKTGIANCERPACLSACIRSSPLYAAVG